LKISGFISYSHSDGKEITEGLYEYLTNLLPNFQPIYDDNVPEGNKIEKIKEKLSLCHILIVIITPASINSISISEEITLAKERGMKVIPCKDKYVTQGWNELPWDINEYKGIDFENSGELKRKLVYTLSKTIQEVVEELEPLKTEIQASKETIDQMSLIVQTDKSVYIYNSDMICSIINPNKESNIPISLKIFDEEKKIVYKNSIPIDPQGTGIYQEIIRIGGEGWLKKPGSQYVIVAEHEGKTARLVFFLSDFGVSIELDQKVYSWKDIVRIVVVAPDLNLDSDKVERIGDNQDSLITIKTKLGTLTNYELVETGPDTGIFIGELHLTGFHHDPLGNGKVPTGFGMTLGNGPDNGMIAADYDDEITVILKTPYKTYSGGALIRWNIGEAQWMQAEYKIGDTGVFAIIDPDMNLNPNLIDMFEVRIWSDSDPVGTKVLVIETGPETGIFKGDIQFGTETKGTAIMVEKGNTVCVEYIDHTLPCPYNKNDNLKITSMAIIK